ncbi:ATP-binding protein [Ktedonobacteria bacterium brp13]|nr:ATP-binding protein [Ktedonobacteria bacterium brp13]
MSRTTIDLTMQEALPAWYREFSTLFGAGAGHCFILYGDVHGVTSMRGASQLRFMQGILHTERRNIIAYYHRAIGITFPLPSMRADALALLGSDWTLPPSDDDFSAALDATGITVRTASQGDVFSSARRPREALAVLESLLRAGGPEERGRVAIILDGADLICPATSKAVMRDDQLSILATLQYWGLDSSLGKQDNPVFLLTPRLSDLHPDLRMSGSGYKVIEESLPDEQTRLSYIRWYLEDHRREDPIALIDLTREDLARNTAGLELRQVEDILLLGANNGNERETTEGTGATGVTRLLVKTRKDAIIRQQYSEAIVMLDPLPEGFAGLGGMEQLIDFTREEVIAPLREGWRRDVPKGILLVGPPGNGKTRYVEAAAKELGYNALSLRMATILGGVVGTSERNLQELFDVARSLSPTILFIDEIDQTLVAQRGNTSGSPVAANLFGALLTFMGDEAIRGQVIVVGATNHPELLDAALLRPGRFDVIFPVLCPDEDARRMMLVVQARLQETAIIPDALSLIAQQTGHYSAADLEAVVKEARLLARWNDRTSIGRQEAQEALENIRPVTLALVETFTRRAVDACNNLRFLPPAMAARERERRRAALSVQEQEAGSITSISEARSSRRV